MHVARPNASTPAIRFGTLGLFIEGEARVIVGEVLAFLQGGNSLSVGTRDAQLLPECARALALRAWDDGRHVSVFVPDGPGRRTLQNLRDNGQVAIGVSYPLDHRTLQLKGTVRALSPASEEDTLYVEQCVAQLAQVLDQLGLPAHIVQRVNRTPCTRVDVLVERLYQQTPGPDAGAPLLGAQP